jgi:hypothetical protein
VTSDVQAGAAASHRRAEDERNRLGMTKIALTKQARIVTYDRLATQEALLGRAR